MKYLLGAVWGCISMELVDILRELLYETFPMVSCRSIEEEKRERLRCRSAAVVHVESANSNKLTAGYE